MKVDIREYQGMREIRRVAALGHEGKRMPQYAYFFSKTFNNVLIIQNFAVKSRCHVEFITGVLTHVDIELALIHT